MESLNSSSANSEIFDESALLSYVDGNKKDAENLLSIALMEMHESLDNMRLHIELEDLNGIIVDAVNVRGVAGAMASHAIYSTAKRAANSVMEGDLEGVKTSYKDMYAFLKELEVILKRKGWH